MKTLFLRIFLSFWLAMGLIIATSIIVSATVAYQRLQALDAVEPSDLADQAAARLAKEGKPGLLAWIDEAEKTHAGLRIFIVGEHGADLLGRSLPERIMRRIGLAPETRKFTPHVTLARLRGTSSVAVADYLSLRGFPPRGAWLAEQFVVYSSRDSVGGGPYVIEAEYPLGEQEQQSAAG